MGAAPRESQGVASGSLATFRYIGMMAGITVGGSLFDFLLTLYAKHSNPYSTTFILAFSHTMWIGALLGLCGVLCTLFMTRNKGSVTI